MKTLVVFNGGPFHGQADGDSDELRGSGVVMIEMAYRDYAAHPPAPGAPRWVLCRVHNGRAAGPHFYKIVSDETKAGRLELSCDYGGTEYPAETKRAA
jgi:hypothetical protein